ncbi:MAG: carboxypeptidase regulatory-like domain-containing protein [Gemmatimonadetes bacterium]|nr:carboxypeptidase regulatory-like domain-containing protein [Gemmatimonadota bacterium]
MRSSMGDGDRLVPRAIFVSGGEVAEIRRAGQLLYDGGGATWGARLRRADTLTVLAGATVELTGSGYVATADSAGAAQLMHVLPGRYHVAVSTPMMREARLSPIERDVEIRDVARVDTVALPSVEALVARQCGRPRAQPAGEPLPAMLFGTVTDDAGRPVAGATVALSYPPRARVVADGRVEATTSSADITADGDGRWRACGVPRDRPLELRALGDGRASPLARVRVDPSLGALRVPLIIRRPAPMPGGSQ